MTSSSVLRLCCLPICLCLPRLHTLNTLCPNYAFNMEGRNTDSEVITIDSDSDDLDVTHYVKSTPTTATSMYYTLRKRDCY